MNEKRIIKKYPNRRLYDTVISSYITLEDVRKLVVEDVPIKIIDARTKEDLTHSTLLQIIVDQEESGPPVFSNQTLEQMIRFYGQSMQSILNQFFHTSFGFFNKQQDEQGAPAAGFKDWIARDPLAVIHDVTQRNVSLWQAWQKEWMSSFPAKGNPSSQEEGNIEKQDEPLER